MRRRNLLGGGGTLGTLAFSSNSGTANAKNNSYVTFTVNYNDVALTDTNVIVTSSESWATPTWTASSSTVKVTCKSNTSISNTRTAMITVTYKGASADYSLTQSKGSWSLSSTSYAANPVGNSTSFYLKINGSKYSGTDYTVSESLSWVTTSKSGGTITVTYTDNTGSSTRSGTITVTFSGQSKTFTLTQQGISSLLSVRFSNGSTLAFNNWPSVDSGIIPIGVVIPGLNACMSLRDMNYLTPDTGNGDSIWGDSMSNGGYGYNIAGLSHYDTLKNAKTDMNGKTNTSTILAVDNSYSTEWQTANEISNVHNNQYVHPAAQCCWRFHPAGTNKGDWYLPSAGEMYTMSTYYNEVENTIQALKDKVYYYGSDSLKQRYYTSTRASDTSWWEIVPRNGAGFDTEDVYDFNIRAFMKL